MRKGDNAYKRKFTLPGFISVLRSEEKEALTVEYSHTAMLTDSLAPFRSAINRNLLRLSLRKDDGMNRLCAADSIDALDVAPLIAEVQKAAAVLDRFFQGKLPMRDWSK